MKMINLVPKKVAILAALFFIFGNVKSQNIGEILSVGPEDLEKYLELYVAPGMNALGNGMANGWVNTAKPHKLLGFDITVGVANGLIPETDLRFAFNPADFENLQYDGNGTLPTFVGGEPVAGEQLFITAGQTITAPDGSTLNVEQDIRFNPPPGLNTDDLPFVSFPAPYLQVGVGLIKGTEVKVRWIPGSIFEGISSDISAPSLFGIGVLHDFKQWIPGMKLLPFDLSAFIGTTNFEYSQDFADLNQQFNGGSVTSSNGSATVSTRATTVQVMISKKIAVLTPYASVGFNAIRSEIQVDGDYTYSIDTQAGPQSITFTDPVDLQFDGAGGPRMTVGARLKLLVLTLHADYTLQRYNTFTAGIGISVR
jgi:hypothetical protein